MIAHQHTTLKRRLGDVNEARLVTRRQVYGSLSVSGGTMEIGGEVGWANEKYAIYCAVAASQSLPPTVECLVISECTPGKVDVEIPYSQCFVLTARSRAALFA